MTDETFTTTGRARLFEAARTYNGWTDQPVPESALRELYDLAKLGPTSGNSSPARFVFVTTPQAKARLAPHLSEANHAKIMAAPVCAIIGYDLDFADKLIQLFPHNPGAKSWYADPTVRQDTAMRNSSLQGAYLIMAARLLGYDCGPISGFDNAGIDRDFFPDGRIRSNFLCALGKGDPASLMPRLPRLSFEDACAIV